MSTALWTAVDAASATGGRSRRYWEAERVSIDSRDTRTGDLFIALRGPANDGHRFVDQALREGAAAAVVEQKPENVSEDAPLLVVEDSMNALQALGGYGRKRSDAQIAGITGSVGKTGFKSALSAICGTVAPTHASAKSHNNHWGVPLSLANLPLAARFGIFEMGMNHAGEIRDLTIQVKPHVAVITTIAAAHMEFFEGLDAIAEAKAEIFDGLVENGVAVIHTDAPCAEILIQRAKERSAEVYGFGRREDARVRLIDAGLKSDRSTVAAEIDGQRLDFEVGIPGKHWVDNSLGLIAASLALKLPIRSVLDTLSELHPEPGRGERQFIAVKGDEKILLLDESYNANPASMRAAFDVLARQQGRKVAILGDMLELGAQSASMHADLLGPLKDADVSLLILAGSSMGSLHEAAEPSITSHHFADSAALAAHLERLIQPGDVVLIKGSLGSQMARAVDAIKARGVGSTKARSSNDEREGV